LIFAALFRGPFVPPDTVYCIGWRVSMPLLLLSCRNHGFVGEIAWTWLQTGSRAAGGLFQFALDVWSRDVMVRTWCEADRVGLPCLANCFVERDTSKGLEPAAEGGGGDKVAEVLPKLVVSVVVIAFDGGGLERAVLPFDLTIGPGIFGLVSRWSMSCSERASSNEWARKSSPLAMASSISGTAEPPAPGVVKGMPLSVEKVCPLFGTVSTRCCRKSPDSRVVAFSYSSTKANMKVRSIAMNRLSFPCPVRTLAMSM